MGDFLAFRRMITPLLIQAIFWVATAAAVLFGVGLLGRNPPLGILVLVLGPLSIRVWCELLILFFRMNETLTDIRNAAPAFGTTSGPPRDALAQPAAGVALTPAVPDEGIR